MLYYLFRISKWDIVNAQKNELNPVYFNVEKKYPDNNVKKKSPQISYNIHNH